MITVPFMDPVAIAIGPLKIHWYGLSYLLGFAAVWWLLRRRAGSPLAPRWTPDMVGDIIFYAALGVILGGRLGYVLFYKAGQLLSDPLFVVRIWDGGMSFHGGLIGVLLVMLWYGRKHNLGFFEVADFATPAIPIALCAGRLGNFINAELWGRVTDLPWGMVFNVPNAGSYPRHPSSLYQASLEGLALFVLLWWFSRKPRPRGMVSGLFLIGYALFRGFAEFWREPDAHIGYLAFDWFTMGHLLSLPMLLAGVVMLWWSYRQPAGS